jgi:peptide/nickel transport system permease protein
VIAVIAILAWPQIALVMRSEVYRVKQIDFVDAVRCLGYSEIYILVREVVPNALRSVVALGTLIVGQAILIEASLSFLGLSSPDVISWGGMLNSGQRYLFNAWWLSVLPGIAIFLTVLAFNFIGDALNAALNPKDTGR